MVASAIVSALEIFLFDIEQHNNTCVHILSSLINESNIIYAIIVIITYSLILLLLVVTTGLIAFKLLFGEPILVENSQLTSAQKRRFERDQKVTRVIIATAVTFAIFGSAELIGTLSVEFGFWNDVFVMVVSSLGMLNSFASIFIYSVFGSEFQEVVKTLLLCKWRK